jgi:1-deoxy-D-xylulose-5-phosphate reductoisomerase
MTIPISYILAYPDRLSLEHLPSLDLASTSQLTFFEPDFEKFPCLRLAYAALQQGGTCPAVLNAANEIAVESFLAGRIRFPDIAALNERILRMHAPQSVSGLEVLLEADRWAREQARFVLNGLPPQAASSA